MVTVSELIKRLSQYDGNSVVSMSARNYDGSADADLIVGTEVIATNVDYYNTDEIMLY